MSKLRWGIVATGNVATEFTTDLLRSTNSEVVAVSSRSVEKAKRFAERFSINSAYDSYDKLYQDPDIDIVYIATPHTGHYENTLCALSAGKHVLCEKPLAMDATQVEQCQRLAKSRQRFMMEAVWMYFFPALRHVESLLQDARIGKPKLLEAALCFTAPQNPENRLFNPDLGGGALFDIGLYPLFLATKLFGEATIDSAHCVKSASGVDVFNQLVCYHKNGVISSLQASLQYERPCIATIVGTQGYIRINHRFFCPTEVTLHRYDESHETWAFPYEGNGYQFEIQEVENCISKGLCASPDYPPSLLSHNHRLLNQALAHFAR